MARTHVKRSAAKPRAKHATTRRATGGKRTSSSGTRHRHGHRMVVRAGLRTRRNRWEHRGKAAPRAHRTRITHLHSTRLKVTRIVHKKRR